MSVYHPDFWQGTDTVVPATLRGYRTWRVAQTDDGARLASTAQPFVWDAEVTADCLKPSAVGERKQDCPCIFCGGGPEHGAPFDGCGCGIYGWYRPDDSHLVPGPVFGVVEASGRVAMATHGFRAEKARLVAVAIQPPTGHPSMTSLLAAMAGSPSGEQLHDIARWCAERSIPVFTDRQAMLEEFPPQDVSALVEHDCSEECSAWNGPRRRSDHISGSVTLDISQFVSSVTAAAAAVPAAATATATYKPAESKPARWKRWGAIIGSALVLLLMLASVAIRTTSAVLADDLLHGLGHAALAAMFVGFGELWRRNLLRAWRWGR